MRFERVELRGPEFPVRFEPRLDFEQRLGPQPVAAALRFDAHRNQSGLAQRAQMLRYARLAEACPLDQFADRALAFANQIKDPSPVRFGEDLEHVGRSHRYVLIDICIIIVLYNYQGRYNGQPQGATRSGFRDASSASRSRTGRL